MNSYPLCVSEKPRWLGATKTRQSKLEPDWPAAFAQCLVWQTTSSTSTTPASSPSSVCPHYHLRARPVPPWADNLEHERNTASLPPSARSPSTSSARRTPASSPSSVCPHYHPRARPVPPWADNLEHERNTTSLPPSARSPCTSSARRTPTSSVFHASPPLPPSARLPSASLGRQPHARVQDRRHYHRPHACPALEFLNLVQVFGDAFFSYFQRMTHGSSGSWPYSTERACDENLFWSLDPTSPR